MKMISIDDLIEYCDSEAYKANNCGAACTALRRVAEFAKENAVEAEPVKHGRWEVNGDRFCPFCSNCKYEPPKELIRCNALSLEPILTKYCPNCGCKQDL